MSNFNPLIMTTNSAPSLKPYLHIGGFIPLTTIDFPNHLSCVIFCQGCAWRCRYCHNVDLIAPRGANEIAWDEIICFLEKRKGLLEAVVFSGGEPTLQPDLIKCIEQVKAMGYLVGLHSAGIKPKVFEQIVNKADWVGFDIKALPEEHQKITCTSRSGEVNWLSLKYLLASDVNYEVRTTVHWHLFSISSIKKLAQKLYAEGVRTFAMQIARSQHNLDTKLHRADTPQEIQLLWQYLENLFPQFILRDS